MKGMAWEKMGGDDEGGIVGIRGEGVREGLRERLLVMRGGLLRKGEGVRGYGMSTRIRVRGFVLEERYRKS